MLLGETTPWINGGSTSGPKSHEDTRIKRVQISHFHGKYELDGPFQEPDSENTPQDELACVDTPGC